MDTSFFWNWFLNNNEQLTMLDDLNDTERQQLLDAMQHQLDGYSEDSMTGISCEACGVMIRSGRYCEACRTGLMSGFKAISSEIKTASQANAKQPAAGNSNGPRMRFR